MTFAKNGEKHQQEYTEMLICLGFSRNKQIPGVNVHVT